MKVADIVRSCAGHDKGHVFIVMAVDGEYVVLADGRHRRVEKPKRKKQMHTQKIATADGEIAQILHNGEAIANKALWTALRPYREV